LAMTCSSWLSSCHAPILDVAMPMMSLIGMGAPFETKKKRGKEEKKKRGRGRKIVKAEKKRRRRKVPERNWKKKRISVSPLHRIGGR
jgi:hypothetical protein